MLGESDRRKCDGWFDHLWCRRLGVGSGSCGVARGLCSTLALDLVFVRVIEDGSPAKRINATADRLERLSEAVNEVDFGAEWVVEYGHPADRLVAAAVET